MEETSEEKRARLYAQFQEGFNKIPVSKDQEREQYYMNEQTRLRAIKFGDASSLEEKELASQALKKLVEEYSKEFPLITGTFTYSKEDVKAAKEAGYYE